MPWMRIRCIFIIFGARMSDHLPSCLAAAALFAILKRLASQMWNTGYIRFFHLFNLICHIILFTQSPQNISSSFLFVLHYQPIRSLRHEEHSCNKLILCSITLDYFTNGKQDRGSNTDSQRIWPPAVDILESYIHSIRHQNSDCNW